MRSKNLKFKIQNLKLKIEFWPRSTMDSIRVSEAPDTGSIPVEATKSLPQRYSKLYETLTKFPTGKGFIIFRLLLIPVNSL